MSQVAGVPVHVRYERYSRTDSVEGHTYAPTGQTARCSTANLRRLADPTRLPGARLASCCGGADVGAELAGAAGGTTAGVRAGATPPGGFGSGSSSRGDTPSCSDGTAAISWRSGSSGCGGASDAISGRGRGDGLTPASGGQQEPAPPASWQVPTKLPIECCDMFCGYGGLSLGIGQALPNFTAKWACDMFPEALDTYKSCHPGEWGGMGGRVGGDKRAGGGSSV
jgi:hypothetical protein